MTIGDGKLYIAEGEHDYYGTYNKGKIVEVHTSIRLVIQLKPDGERAVLSFRH